MVKAYAKWGGIIFLVLGVVGLVTGNKFLGVLNSEILEDIIHLVAGAILAWIGFKGTDAQARTWANIFGIVFLIVGIVGFFSKNLLGLLPAVGLGVLDNLAHLAYGVVGVWAARGYKAATA